MTMIVCGVCHVTRDDKDWCNRPDCSRFKNLTEESLLELLEQIRDHHKLAPAVRILDGDKPYSCPSCGRPPADEPIHCREFNLGAVGRPNVILVGLWANVVLLKLEGVIESALLTKEEAHALAARLHRYADHLP